MIRTGPDEDVGLIDQQENNKHLGGNQETNQLGKTTKRLQTEQETGSKQRSKTRV